jgi:hypothetical protein
MTTSARNYSRPSPLSNRKNSFKKGMQESYVKHVSIASFSTPLEISLPMRKPRKFSLTG